MKRFRTLGLIILTLSIIIMVVSCQSETTPTGTTGTDAGLPNVELANKNVVFYLGLGQSLDSMHSKDPQYPSSLDVFEKVYGGTVSLVNVDWNEYYTKLLALFMANDMPDLLWPMPETFPKDIINNLIQPVDPYGDYIDLQDPIWDSTRQYIEMLSVNNKHYYPILNFSQPDMIVYNPKVFALNELETPYTVYKNDRSMWTWDKLLEYAKALTQDTNSDGVIDQWGLAIGSNGSHLFQETTGVPFVDYSKEKGITNNLKSPAIADAANFVRDLGPAKYNVLDPIESYNAYKNFLAGKDAMIADIQWRISGDYQGLWKDGKIEVVPMPRYPKTDTFYRSGYLFGFLIANKAKNPEGAALYITCQKYTASDAYKQKYGLNTPDEKYKKSDELGIPREQVDLMNDYAQNLQEFPVTINIWLGWYDKGWYNGFQDLPQEPWSQTVARIFPIFEKNIKKNLAKFNEVAYPAASGTESSSTP